MKDGATATENRWRDGMVKLNESMLSLLDGMEEAEARRRKLLNASAMNVNTQTKLPAKLNVQIDDLVYPVAEILESSNGVDKIRINLTERIKLPGAKVHYEFGCIVEKWSDGVILKAKRVREEPQIPADLNSAHCEVLVRQALDAYSESARAGSTQESYLRAYKLKDHIDNMIATIERELGK